MHPILRLDSLTGRLVLPVVGIVLAAVVVNVAFSAWLAERRTAQAAVERQARVAAALVESRVALSPAVLEALHALTGSHFLVWNPKTGETGDGTVALGGAGGPDLADAVTTGRIEYAGERYRVGVVQAAGARPEKVLLFTPERPVAAVLEATWPVLAVAAATLALLVPLSLRMTRSLATRISAVERHVKRIGAGDFSRRATDEGRDEVGQLAEGVNALATALADLRASLVAGERQRLLGQLAAGFAHELRNAVTGARLAIDVHSRRCEKTGDATDESLSIARRQLAIVEEEVRGLLALGRPAEAARGPVAVDDLIAAVRDLTAPRCEHAGVRLECEIPSGITLVGRQDSLRAALVNLALNGIEAAGRGGLVHVSAATADGRIELAVEDTGPGPAEEIRAVLGEPFTTSKPEGIGLGLAIAKAVAEEHGGGLAWDRRRDRTRFAIWLPAQTLDGSFAPSAAEPPA